MEIKTKFTLGTSVWSILNGRAHGFEIKAIVVTKGDKGSAEIEYRDSSYHTYPEHQCFIAKEELRDYFMGGK